jgi:endonuclease G
MAYIDDYLLGQFEAFARWREQLLIAGERESAALYENPRVPMMLRVNDPSWQAETPQYEERFRIGNIVACSGTRSTLYGLNDDPRVIAVEASRITGYQDCGVSVPSVKGNIVHRPPISELGDFAIIGIIDGGIDLQHEAFLGKRVGGRKQCRIRAIWDQRTSVGPSPSGFSFGTHYTASDIQAFIDDPSSIPSELRENNEHGTHVTSIAAGRGTANFEGFSGGMAPEADIVVVIPDLKTYPPDPHSLGYSQCHCAALAYIKQFAEQHNKPVVVNMSLGMNAGGHDGGSLLETTIDSISQIGRVPGFVVVKSAGNERGQHRHACLTVATGVTETLEWESSRGDVGVNHADYLEVWFKSCDQIRFRLTSSCGDVSKSWVHNSAPHDVGSFINSHDEFQLRLTRHHHDNGDSCLAVRRWNTTTNGLSVGKWQLEIEALSIKSNGVIHAWIDRQPTRRPKFSNHRNSQSDETTISVPGTAISSITVGATARDGTGVASFSSFGPTRDMREKPDICAPGDSIKGAEAGTLNRIMPESGTSMAAPHVTGAIALALSRRAKQRQRDKTIQMFNGVQIKAAICQAAQNFTGRWNPKSGYGLLDAEALLKALD